MISLPSGTVAFLMTDIEGSTRLVASAGGQFPRLLDEYFALLDSAVKTNGGTVVSSEGDSLFAVFPAARQALAAAIDGQRGIRGHGWPDGMQLKVRMGIHAGEAVFGGRDYTGLEVHRTARLTAAGWGGEILVSEAARTLAGDALPEGASLRDLGVHSLRDLPAPERLFQLCAPGLDIDFPAPRTMTVATRTNLPALLTRFVGRRRELAEVGELLTNERLVTLTGPGGTGKTRLAIEVARAGLGSFPEGVWFVALDTVRDPQLVVPTIAQTLSVPDRPGRTTADMLAEHLAGKQALLVLDNLEQVVGAAPELGQLLAATTGVTILGSSREPLGLAGERVYPVQTLGLPAEPGRPRAADLADSDSVELFVERARAARPDFALTDENAPAIAAICRRLDGLPLAIELAAARVSLLPPAQIVTRLDHRLTLVASSRRDLPERQRTLRGAIDWSYDLLAEPERAVFRRFSVFSGGADLDAVLAVLDPDGSVGADPLDVMSALVDRSLIRSDQARDEVRFEMLETIREYAAEKSAEAGDEASTRARHAAFYAGLAGRARDVLMDPNRDVVLDRLDRELPNLRAAMNWSLSSSDHAPGLTIAASLKDFWRTRNHLTEARRALDDLLAASEVDGQTALRISAVGAAAELAAWHTDYARAQQLSQAAIAMLEATGDRRGLGQAFVGVGWANLMARPEVAGDAFRQSIAIAHELGDESWLMGSLQGLSLVLFRLGELDEARAVAHQAIVVGDRSGDSYTNAMNYLTLGMLELATGNVTAAVERFVEGLHRARAARAHIGLALAFDALATAAVTRGNPGAGARLASVAERLRREMGGGPSMNLIGMESPLDQARAAMESADYELALADADSLTTDEAAELALSVAAADGSAKPE